MSWPGVFDIGWTNPPCPEDFPDAQVSYQCDGGDWQSIPCGGESGKDGKDVCAWQVPHLNSSDCWVSVQYPGWAYATVGPFSIMARDSLVTSPHGGEFWFVDSSYWITWHPCFSGGDVNIEYSTNDGVDWDSIETNYPNYGEYYWTIPNTPSAYCKVRICSVDYPYLCASSDGDFMIGYGGCVESITNIDPPSWTIPPMKVSPTGSRVISFHLKGIGSLAGSYTVTPTTGPVKCISNCTGTLQPGDDNLVQIGVSCSGQGFIKDTIIIRRCIGTPEEDTISIPLYAVCGDDYYECKRAANTQFRPDNDVESLWVCANTEERAWDKRLPDDSNQVIMTAGVIAAFMDDTLAIIGRQDYTDMRTGARDTIRTVRDYLYAEPDCDVRKIYVTKTYIWYPPDVIPGAPKWYWINLNKQIIVFYDRPGHTCLAGRKDQIIKHVWINWGRYPAWWPSPDAYAGHPDIYYGVFADLDAPYDSGCRAAGGEAQSACNEAGWDNVNKIVWQHGFASTPPQHTPAWDKYYLGMGLTNTAGAIVEPVGCKDVRNAEYLYPNAGWGWQDSQLYRLATTPFNAATVVDDPDSVVDRSVVMTAGKIPASTNPNDTTWQAEFVLIEALLPDGTEDALKAHFVLTRTVIIPHLNSAGVFSKTFPICGDVNCDGKVSAADAVWLSNYLFIHGPNPCWPMCRADCNGDGLITAADAVWLINYLFIHGPKPICPCLGK